MTGHFLTAAEIQERYAITKKVLWNLLKDGIVLPNGRQLRFKVAPATGTRGGRSYRYDSADVQSIAAIPALKNHALQDDLGTWLTYSTAREKAKTAAIPDSAAPSRPAVLAVSSWIVPSA